MNCNAKGAALGMTADQSAALMRGACLIVGASSGHADAPLCFSSRSSPPGADCVGERPGRWYSSAMGIDPTTAEGRELLIGEQPPRITMGQVVGYAVPESGAVWTYATLREAQHTLGHAAEQARAAFERGEQFNALTAYGLGPSYDGYAGGVL